jgi:hypothetical protein
VGAPSNFTVQAASGGQIGLRTLSIRIAAPTSIIIVMTDSVLLAGATLQGTAAVLDQDGKSLSDMAVVWESNDEDVATISQAGLITAYTRGLTMITARSGSLSATTPVRVSSPRGLFGWSCVNRVDPDVASGVVFKTTDPVGAKYHGCLVVDSTEAHPVLTGRRSFRFQVSPGDCTTNDCTTDRSRHEIEESMARLGQVIRYELSVYIPGIRVRPRGGSILVLSQFPIVDGSYFGSLGAIMVDNGNRLIFRFHEGFTGGISAEPVLTADIFDRWIRIVVEVKYATDESGYITVSVDDVEKYRTLRPTLPTHSAAGMFRIGIYNAFMSRAVEPYFDQVVYFDRVIRTVR